LIPLGGSCRESQIPAAPLQKKKKEKRNNSIQNYMLPGKEHSVTEQAPLFTEDGVQGVTWIGYNVQ